MERLRKIFRNLPSYIRRETFLELKDHKYRDYKIDIVPTDISIGTYVTIYSFNMVFENASYKIHFSYLHRMDLLRTETEKIG